MATTVTGKKPRTKAPTKPRGAKVSINMVIQYQGKETTQADLVAAAKDAWTAAGKEGEIKTLDFYIKPEDGMVYSVVNGEENGAIAL